MTETQRQNIAAEITDYLAELHGIPLPPVTAARYSQRVAVPSAAPVPVPVPSTPAPVPVPSTAPDPVPSAAAPKFGRLSNFLIELAAATKNKDYDFQTFTELVKLENESGLVVSHGDFNPDNILVSCQNPDAHANPVPYTAQKPHTGSVPNPHIVCVIDYAFASLSTPFADISRICNRMPAITKYFPARCASADLAFSQIRRSSADLVPNPKLIAMWDYVDSNYIEYMKKYHREVDI
jgi:thiamine kinase-like enzyme